MFKVWDVGGSAILGVRDVWYVGCSGFGILEMWNVGYGMFAEMWDADLQNAF